MLLVLVGVLLLVLVALLFPLVTPLVLLVLVGAVLLDLLVALEELAAEEERLWVVLPPLLTPWFPYLELNLGEVLRPFKPVAPEP